MRYLQGAPEIIQPSHREPEMRREQNLYHCGDIEARSTGAVNLAVKQFHQC